MLTVAALNGLLRQEAEGTFFLRNVLVDYATEDAMEKIMVQVGKTYQRCEKAEKRTFTPIFHFVETTPDQLRLIISRHIGLERKEVGYVDLVAGSRGVYLSEPSWKDVEKGYWSRVTFKDARNRVEAIKELLDETQYTLLSFHFNILHTAAVGSKAGDLSFDLEFNDYGIMVVVYHKTKLFTSFFVSGQ